VENVGTRPSRTLKVWVSALDASGLARQRVDALPTPQDVAPGTGRAFVVQLADDPRCARITSRRSAAER
jgi:hypothetical protein